MHQTTVYTFDSTTFATLCLWYIRFLPGWSGQKLSVPLPKELKDRFQPEWQSRQQALKAYCSNICTVHQTVINKVQII